MDAITEFLRMEQGEDPEQMEKSAAVPPGTGAMLKNVAGRVGTEAATALAVAGVLWGGSKAVQAASAAVNRRRGYKQMLEINPDLAERDQKQVKGMYNLMYKAAPTMAQNPYVAGGFVRKTEHAAQYVDPKMVADLADAEAKVQKAQWSAVDVPIRLGTSVHRQDWSTMPGPLGGGGKQDGGKQGGGQGGSPF